MTGPEHYAEAERLLNSALPAQVIPGYGPVIQTPAEPDAIARAHVHATLALAAAVAGSRIGDFSVPDSDAWYTAAGTPLDIKGQQR